MDDFLTYVTNGATQLSSAYDIVGVVCYLFAVIFMASALIYAASAGAQRNQSWLPAIGCFLTSVFLFGLPTVAGVAISTMSGQNTAMSIMGYSPPNADAMSAQALAGLQAVLQWVQFIGVLSIVRGVFLIRSATSGSSSHGFASVVVFIMGGAAAANIVFTLNLLHDWFGVGVSVSG
jgi:hypothetical protein